MGGSLTENRPNNNSAMECSVVIAAWLGLNKGAMSLGEYCIVGSVMRIVKESYGDIDIVIVPNDDSAKEVILSKIALVFGYNKCGTPKMQGIIGQYQVDLFITDKGMRALQFSFISCLKTYRLPQG